MTHVFLALALLIQPLLAAAPSIRASASHGEAADNCCGSACCCETGTCPCSAQAPERLPEVPAVPPTAPAARNLLASLACPPVLPVPAYADARNAPEPPDCFTSPIFPAGHDAQPALCLWLI